MINIQREVSQVEVFQVRNHRQWVRVRDVVNKCQPQEVRNQMYHTPVKRWRSVKVFFNNQLVLNLIVPQSNNQKTYKIKTNNNKSIILKNRTKKNQKKLKSFSNNHQQSTHRVNKNNKLLLKFSHKRKHYVIQKYIKMFQILHKIMTSPIMVLVMGDKNK